VIARVTGEPGYVLHYYSWSESSVIVEAFTRRFGRMTLVARGAKKPSSNFRPVLLPMQALVLAWTGDSEVRNLKGVEWGGGPVMSTLGRSSETLLACYYVNELLLRLLAREDPHQNLFDGYVQLLSTLADPECTPAGRNVALRSFELLLLRQIGLLPVLHTATLTLMPIAQQGEYCLLPEGGLLAHEETEPDVLTLPGTHWITLEKALSERVPFNALLTVIKSWAARERTKLRQIMRVWFDAQCGGRILKTRQLMDELRSI
jgi:DNA repair protein RecO (recombination protein O)